MNLRDKTVVITGAGSGMGRELTFGLLARGARVAAVDVSKAALAETGALAKASSGSLATFVVDITQRDAVEALPVQVAAALGDVDGLINNAGIIQPFVTVHDLGYDAIERVMHVNFYGTLYMVKAFLPRLLQRPVAHIVNVSSMGGFVPVPGQTVYGASKAAVKLLTEGLASELTGTAVRVTLVCPGAVRTNITVNSGVAMPAAPSSSSASPPKGAAALPAAAAAAIILDGIERNRPRVMVGRDARTMDWLYRANPVRAARLIQRQMAGLLARAETRQ